MNKAKHIIDILKSGRNVFLTGGAGVGKSYTIDQIINSQVFKPVVLASTALAAVNIGGETVHRFFKLRLAKNMQELRTSKEDLQQLNSALSQINLIIIDEISMISADIFDMIYHRLLGYSNIRLLIVGDFYQLEPVKAEGNYAFLSKYWQECDFKVVELSTQHRVDDKLFYEHLKSIRMGNITNNCIEFFEKYKIKDSLQNYDDYTIICGTNKEAQTINMNQLNKLEGDEFCFTSKVIKSKELNAEEEEELKHWIKAQPIEENFKFKIGAKVIFTSTYDTCYNGMQATIIGYNPIEKELSVKSNDRIYSVKPREFYFFSDPEVAATYRINPMLVDTKPDVIIQAFSLKLAYAITIHKSQGMSISRLICKCDNIFAQGQLYVALSRASNPDEFKISFDGSEKTFQNMFKTKARANSSVKNFYLFSDREIL